MLAVAVAEAGSGGETPGVSRRRAAVSLVEGADEFGSRDMGLSLTCSDSMRRLEHWGGADRRQEADLSGRWNILPCCCANRRLEVRWRRL